jgi:hypothetical protein
MTSIIFIRETILSNEKIFEKFFLKRNLDLRIAYRAEHEKEERLLPNLDFLRPSLTHLKKNLLNKGTSSNSMRVEKNVRIFRNLFKET